MQETAALSGMISPNLEALVERWLETSLGARQQEQASSPKKMALICSKGTLDEAYPPLVLATTAAPTAGRWGSSSRSTA